jgi:uncharacterized membrane protein YeaQ/YmgE (transglycosylase-associated protein family)
MGIVTWIALGLVAGLIARWLMPGKSPGGLVYTILLGIVGALVGGLVGTQLLGISDVTGFNLHSLAIAVGGAVLVLLGYAFLKNKGLL